MLSTRKYIYLHHQKYIITHVINNLKSLLHSLMEGAYFFRPFFSCSLITLWKGLANPDKKWFNYLKKIRYQN